MKWRQYLIRWSSKRSWRMTFHLDFGLLSLNCVSNKHKISSIHRHHVQHTNNNGIEQWRHDVVYNCNRCLLHISVTDFCVVCGSHMSYLHVSKVSLQQTNRPLESRAEHIFYILIIQIYRKFCFFIWVLIAEYYAIKMICIHMILYYLLILDVTYKTLSIYLVNEKIIVSSFLWSSRPLAIFSSQNISNLYLYFRCYAIFSTRSGPKLYLMHIHKFWQIVRHKKYDQSNENRGNFNSLLFLTFIFIK